MNTAAGGFDLARRPVTQLRRVGPAMAEKLRKLGIETVQDLLFHLPLRYQDRTRIVPMGCLRPGDEAVVEGDVLASDIRYGKRRSLLVRIGDGSGSLTLRFFYFNQSQKSQLARGARLRCYGEVRSGPSSLELIHPEYRVLHGDAPQAVEEYLTPVYPATEGIQQNTLRGLMQQALELLNKEPEALLDWLPESLLPAGESLPGLHTSLQYLHHPPPDAPLELLEEYRHPSQQRLALEELLGHHLALRRLREQAQSFHASPLQGDSRLTGMLEANLPFRLTGAQQRVRDEIRNDLSRAIPMQRLVQGDVGSGKTVVAALAMLQAVEAGRQAALMAPTELLAEQHYINLSAWLKPLNVGVEWLSGRMKSTERRQALERIGSGEAQVVIGTHALFQEEVEFAAIALVVVDEQHRFGVHQRLALREKGAGVNGHPHQLIMTATPIPRTLAMTAYADLDLSVIDERPPGRTPVETAVVPDNRRDALVQRVDSACAEGRQVYWVCSLIEESEALQCEAAEDTAEALAAALPERRIALVHGRMKSAERSAIMDGFKKHDIDLLVATTVIEVGVDVPNASLMIIENAERLGLAQLHQLRGRVGRGTAKSSCVLMYHGRLSENAGRRLAIMRETDDGFRIAEEDLRIRGPGELLGTRQTGLPRMRVADLERDAALLQRVAQIANHLIEEKPAAVEALIRRWLRDSDRYAKV